MTLLGRKTVASVMATFTKTITDLNTVADNNDSIVANLVVEQEKIASNIEEALGEAQSARAIAAKLSDIVDV